MAHRLPVPTWSYLLFHSFVQRYKPSCWWVFWLVTWTRSCLSMHNCLLIVLILEMTSGFFMTIVSGIYHPRWPILSRMEVLLPSEMKVKLSLPVYPMWHNRWIHAFVQSLWIQVTHLRLPIFATAVPFKWSQIQSFYHSLIARIGWLAIVSDSISTAFALTIMMVSFQLQPHR